MIRDVLLTAAVHVFVPAAAGDDLTIDSTGVEYGSGVRMTALPPDPDPSDTTGLSRGGGVQPGDTPPDSGSLSASANQDPPPRRQFTPAAIAGMIAVGVIFAVFLTVAVLYGLQVAGLMDRW